MPFSSWNFHPPVLAFEQVNTFSISLPAPRGVLAADIDHVGTVLPMSKPQCTMNNLSGHLVCV
jgi:hypothetical protein